METNLENINSNLIKCINDIHQKKILIDNDITEFSKEEELLENDIEILNNRLLQVKEILNSKTLERDFYNKRIIETETAYEKICSSTALLLNVIKPNN